MSVINSSIITASTDVVGCELAGGLALLDLRSGSYFNLNQTGAYFWSQLVGPKVLGDILKSMSETYEVAPEVLERDLQTLITELSQQGLVIIGE